MEKRGKMNIQEIKETVLLSEDEVNQLLERKKTTFPKLIADFTEKLDGRLYDISKITIFDKRYVKLRFAQCIGVDEDEYSEVLSEIKNDIHRGSYAIEGLANSSIDNVVYLVEEIGRLRRTIENQTKEEK